jgi:hypothetical protein
VSCSQRHFLGRYALEYSILVIFGRGSWIRTNDLQYPKLPRYQAALYPDFPREEVDTRSERSQQGTAIGLNRVATTCEERSASSD